MAARYRLAGGDKATVGSCCLVGGVLNTGGGGGGVGGVRGVVGRCGVERVVT